MSGEEANAVLGGVFVCCVRHPSVLGVAMRRVRLWVRVACCAVVIHEDLRGKICTPSMNLCMTREFSSYWRMLQGTKHHAASECLVPESL